MFLTLDNFVFECPEQITPGIELRVEGAPRVAHLKDTGGNGVSFEAWNESGLNNGWNASLEFLKAYIIRPARNTKQAFPGKTDAEIITACLEKAKPSEYTLDKDEQWQRTTVGEADLIYEDYKEKKAQRNPSVTKSESNTTDSPVAENPSA